ncbi:MAG: CDP-alcohol phosphatidyltransferase family protein [Candidatus Amoebophilus sp.]
MEHINVKKWNSYSVYLLIPNIVGYIRTLLSVLAFYVCFSKPYWFITLYGISQLLDSLDGYIARRLNQASAYGAMLDMMIDRSSTTALLIILSNFYPAYIQYFIVIILLDVISHFTYIYSSLSYGKKSHKSIAKNQFSILRIYYGYKPMLFLLCLGSEIYLLWLYMRHFKIQLALDPYLESCAYPIFTYLFGSLFVMKQIINIAQLLQAVKDMVRLDVNK